MLTSMKIKHKPTSNMKKMPITVCCGLASSPVIRVAEFNTINTVILYVCTFHTHCQIEGDIQISGVIITRPFRFHLTHLKIVHISLKQ